MKRYYFDNDESGHWYLVPLKYKKLFNKLLYNEESEIEFEDKFGDMRLGSHISCYSFINPLLVL